jgi:hypothetical protein
MCGQQPSPALSEVEGAVQPGKARQFAMLLLWVVLMSLPFVAQTQKPTAAKPTEDLPAGPMQGKATTACTECHEARIILQQRLSKGAWVKEVDKMIKWGAVVDATDHDALIDYLSTNFSPDQPPYVAPRSSSERTAPTTTK